MIEFDEPHHDYIILMHLLPPMVNGDYTCFQLDDHGNDDEAKLREWIDEHGDDFYPVMNPEFPDDMIQYMAKCDITGKIGWCVEIVKG